jgi:RHS repeat-associated protein
MEVNKGEGFTYLYAEGKPFAIYKSNTDEIFYLHLDNQGSLMAISNTDGDVVEKRSYDAWGRPRNPDIIWMYDQTSTFGGAGFGITMRGYTMHEHLEMFNLINMNGRLYDPVLGRMLSPDNYIQSPDNTQSYNRYSYCVNNPLKYTDPDGEIAILIPMLVGAAISATINVAVQGYRYSQDNNYQFNWTSLGVSTLAGAFGGIAGAYGGAAVNAVTGYTSGAIYGAGTGLAGGAVGGFIQGGLGEGNSGWNMNNALTGAAWGAAGGAVIGGALSGLSSFANGRSFWTGREILPPPVTIPSKYNAGDLLKRIGRGTKNGKVIVEKLSKPQFPATNGGKYAFGLKNEVVGFADEIGASHLMKDPNWKSSFRNIINNPKNDIHFTLNGIDDTPMQMILNPGRSGINWEMHTLYNSPAFENTIFRFGGNTYKGFEVFKIKP